MATFKFSEIKNTTLSNFDIANDVLQFDGSEKATDVTVAGTSAGLQLSAGGATVTLAGVTRKNLTDTNVQFSGSGKVIIGDNATGNSADDSANTFTSTNGNALTDTNTLFYGRGGNDVVDVNGADSVIRMNEGDDTVTVNAKGSKVYLGKGKDTLTISDSNDGAVAYGRGGDDNMTGGSGADELRGNTGTDTINGGAGNDKIHGGLGGDSLSGGTGNDDINGGNGHDTIVVGSGNDTVDAGRGFDTIQTELNASTTEQNIVTGGAGDDTFKIGSDDATNGIANANSFQGKVNIKDFTTTAGTVAGNDKLEILTKSGSGFSYQNISATKGSADTTLTFGTSTSSVVLEGFAGLLTQDNVLISGNANQFWLNTGATAASFVGGTGADRGISTDQADTLDGGKGADFLSGGAGNDTIVYDVNDTGADSVDGGTGTDTLLISNANDTAAVDITLSDAGVQAGIETVKVDAAHTSTVAITVNSDYDNDLVGTSATTLTIDGSAIDQTAETLTVNISEGFNNNIVLSGGAANDTFNLNNTTGTQSVTIAGGLGNDNVTFDIDSITSTDQLNGGSQNSSGTTLTDKGDTLTFGDFLVDLSASDLSNVSGFETYVFGANNDAAKDISIVLNNSNVANNFSTTLTIETATIGAGKLTVDASAVTSGTVIAQGGGTDADAFTGGGATDKFTGGTGADVFTFSNSAFSSTDEIRGSSGTADNDESNVLKFSDVASVQASDLTNKYGIDIIEFASSGSNSFVFDATTFTNFGGEVRIDNGSNTLTLNTAQTTFNAANAANVVINGSGQVTLSASGAVSANGAQAINVAGSGTQDYLLGGTGADTFTGNAGADTFVGGAGIDTLTGGSGNDIFVFDQILATNKDSVTDYSASGDVITLDRSALGLGSADDVVDAGEIDVSATGTKTATADIIVLTQAAGFTAATAEDAIVAAYTAGGASGAGDAAVLYYNTDTAKVTLGYDVDADVDGGALVTIAEFDGLTAASLATDFAAADFGFIA